MLAAFVATAAMANVCDSNNDDKYSWCFFSWTQTTPKELYKFLDIHNIHDINKTLDVKKNTVLHRVSTGNTNISVIISLLKDGADTLAQNNSSMTPLHNAAGFNPNPTVVALLVRAGSDVNSRDYLDKIPLHWATQYNDNPVVVAVLLLANSNINSKDKNNKTPAEIAKPSNNAATVIQQHGKAAKEALAAALKITENFTRQAD